MKKLIHLLMVLGFILSIIACTSAAGGDDNNETSIAVESLTIQNAVKRTLSIGETIQLSAEILPKNATDKKVVWKSDNESFATVSKTGLVTAKKETNSVKITATSKSGNKSDFVEFKITKADNSVKVTSLTITNTETSLEEGSSLRLNVVIEPDNATNKALTWSTSDSDCATISDNGVVTAVKETDSVTFTAQTQDGSNISKSFSLSITPKIVMPELQYVRIPYISEIEYGVKGIGTWVDPEVIIPDTYNGYPVTEIYDAAFKNNQNITSVIIGKNVTIIGKEAFYGCSNISEITIPEKVTQIAYLNNGSKGAFDNMEKLKTIYFNAENMPESCYYSNPLIPASVETVYIGKNVQVIPERFCNPSNVQNVIFAEDCACTQISTGAFCGCKQLVSINLPENLEVIQMFAFSECESLKKIDFPSKLKRIEGYSFENCKSLEAVNLPEALTSVTGYDIFKNATAIKTFTFNSNIAFENGISFCDGIGSEQAHTQIIFSDKVTEIAGNLIGKANYIEKVTIGKNVEKIGPKAFYGFATLKTIIFNAKNAVLGENGSQKAVFDESGSAAENGLECIFGKDVEKIPASIFQQHKYISKITFEEGSKCVSIGEYAFYKNSQLTSISLPSTITTIGLRAFQSTGLTSLVLPDSIKEVGLSAFEDCKLIESVDLKNIEVINRYAFQDNTSLKKLVLPASVKACYSDAFYNCRNLEEIDYNAPDLTQIYEDASGSTKYDKCGSIIALKDSTDPKASSLVLKISSQIKTIPREIFQNSNITQIDWGDNSSVEKIGIYAFRGSTGLTEIDLPVTVKEIDIEAFSGCSNVQKLYIKENTTKIGFYAFENMPYISDIYFYAENVEDVPWGESPFGTGNANYKEIAKKQSIILHIGKDVLRIPENFFHPNGKYFNITEVRFAPGSKCTEIGRKTFTSADTFTKIYIPRTIIKIGEWNFYDNKNLKDIYYEGSETEWNKITIEGYNNKIYSATVHYNSTLIE